MFGASTERALAEFQAGRGLHVHGRCDESTWTALVEASYRLGDRMLVLSAPNMRGDDVAELQSVLARLGFDSGRVDGILGPRRWRLEDSNATAGSRPTGSADQKRFERSRCSAARAVLALRRHAP